jgi:hypothetical protein
MYVLLVIAQRKLQVTRFRKQDKDIAKRLETTTDLKTTFAVAVADELALAVVALQLPFPVVPRAGGRRSFPIDLEAKKIN